MIPTKPHIFFIFFFIIFAPTQVHAGCGQAEIMFECQNKKVYNLNLPLCYINATCTPCNRNEVFSEKLIRKCKASKSNLKCWKSIKPIDVAGGLGDGFENFILSTVLQDIVRIKKCE